MYDQKNSNIGKFLCQYCHIVDICFNIYRLPQYMPPEVLCEGPEETDEHGESEPSVSDPCGPKTDVWSLGLILLEVFTVSKGQY